MPVSFHDLRYFRAIVENRTLSAAGNAVGISQPALSKCLKRLEITYGGALIEWQDGCATPTPIGKVVLRNSKDILFRVEDIGREIERLSRGELGDVHVGAGPYVAEVAGKPAMARFIRECPKSCAMMSVAPWYRLIELLYEDHVDFFIGDIGDTILSTDLEVTEISVVSFTWFCRSGHPLAGQSRVSLRALTEFPICGPDAPTRALKWVLDIKRLGAGPHQLAPDQAFSIVCDDWGKLRYFVEHSDCLFLAPRTWICDDVTAGKLAMLDVDYEPLVGRIAAVRVKSAQLSMPARRLLDFFIEELQRYGT